MVRIDEWPCPRDDCDRAYPHPLLKEYHLAVDHEPLSEPEAMIA